MKFSSMKEFNEAQVREIEKFKWIESEKAGYDLGEQAVRQWIMKYAAKFRAENEIEKV